MSQAASGTDAPNARRISGKATAIIVEFNGARIVPRAITGNSQRWASIAALLSDVVGSTRTTPSDCSIARSFHSIPKPWVPFPFYATSVRNGRSDPARSDDAQGRGRAAEADALGPRAREAAQCG